MPSLLEEVNNSQLELLEKWSQKLVDEPFDPAEPPAKEMPKKKDPWVEGSLFKKGLWGGLGVIAWPFERLEFTVATPLHTMMEARKKTLAEKGITHGFSLYASRLLSKDDFMQEAKATLEILGAVGKSWIPGKKQPEAVKTFNDVFGSYYEGMTGEPAPEWYKTISGGGASILITPWMFGKLLKGISGVSKTIANITGLTEKINARSLPAWQKMKDMARLERGARVVDAQDIGKSLSGKEVRKLTKALSERTGRNITPKAVKMRLTQIIKGGITEQPELAKTANPVIEEFSRMSNELKRLKILPQTTYTTKLSKKQAAELLTKKAGLQKQLKGLEKVPYQEKLAELTQKLHPDIVKQKRLQERFLEIAVNAEKRGLKLSQVGDEFIDAAIEVQTGSPLAKKVATLLDFKPGDKRLTILGKRILSLEKMERTARRKEADEIIKIASKLSPKVTKYVNKTVKDILDIAEQIDSTKVVGQSTLLKKIESMQRQFPGKAKKASDLQSKVDDITNRLTEHYHLGGEQYFPRMYLSQEEKLAAQKQFPIFSKERIRAQFAKQRKKIPEDVRKAMGEIKEPGYPVVKRMIQENNAIETGKLFEFAAANPKWASPIDIVGWKRLPDTKGYGALRNMFVHPTLYKDATDLLSTKSTFGRLYDIGMGNWKLTKTVWNPALHFRNMFSNSVLLDLSGMDHIAQAKYIGKAMKHIADNSDEYQQARRYFMRTTQIRGELLDDMLKGFNKSGENGILKIIDGLNRGVSKASATPSQMYGAEEFIGKFLKYLEQRDMGKSVIQAVQESNKWLFDYGDLAQWEKKYARRVMPFYTFPRKAIPRVIEAAANRPLVLAKYPMMAKSMTQYSLYHLELTAKDYDQIEKLLPDYMNKGSYILAPYRDANGDLRFFDWTFNVPWGGLFEAEQRGLLKSAVTNPLATLTFDIMNNKSSWTGRKIWDDAIPEDKWTPAYRKEQNVKKMLYIWQALAPNLMYKGIYWDKIVGAATGKKQRGKDMLLPEAIAHTIFGARTQALDPDEALRWKLYQATEGFDELRGNMVKILMQRSNGDIEEEEFNKKWKVYSEQLQQFQIDALEEEANAPSIEELLDTIQDMQDNPEIYEETKE